MEEQDGFTTIAARDEIYFSTPMIELVRLRSPGDILSLQPHHWENIPEWKQAVAQIGLAIDAAEKEHAALHGAVISDPYAPHDYYLGCYYDIKSTEGRWLSLQHSEYVFAEAEIAEGRDVLYPIYEQLNDKEYRFIGYTSYSKIRFGVRFGKTPFFPMSIVMTNLI